MAPPVRPAIPDSQSTPISQELIERTLREGHRGLTFPQSLEHHFEASRRDTRRRHLLITSSIGTLLYMAFGFLDPLVMPDLGGLGWRIRGILTPIFALLIAGSWLAKRPATREGLAAAGTLLMSLVSSWENGLSRAPTATSHLAVLSLVPMFAGVITRMPFRSLLVVSAGTMAGAIGFVRADNITQTLILRDSVVIVAAATIFALLAGYGLDYRERSRYLFSLLEARQRQALVARNRDMRLVMDNVAQALLTVDASGFLASERSAKADLWFGTYDVPMRFADYIASTDPAFAASFEVGREALVEGVLPQEILLAQLPRSLVGKARHFRCAYHLVADGGDQIAGLIIVIDDVTEEIRNGEEQAEQRELAAILRGIMRDKAGLITTIDEGTGLVRQLQAETASPAIVQRLLHTLKGLSAMAGIERVAALCHHAEDQLEIGEPAIEGVGAIAERWRITCETVRSLVESHGDRTGDVSREDIERLIGQIRGGLSVDAVLAELRQWQQFEPIERGLRRLAQHATLLAARLGKGGIQIDVSAPGLRLDPKIWNPLCAALLQVVRNAVDHGIETPSERTAVGKTPHGRLVARAVSEARSLVIEIQDDGRGIDWVRVRELAVQRKMPAESRADLIHSLLSQGFTTREQVTAVSGRGVGLSVLNEEMQRARGTIDVESEPGVGTTWRVRLPHVGSSAPPALHTNVKSDRDAPRAPPVP